VHKPLHFLSIAGMWGASGSEQACILVFSPVTPVLPLQDTSQATLHAAAASSRNVIRRESLSATGHGTRDVGEPGAPSRSAAPPSYPD
jgi:hypothetical protein